MPTKPKAPSERKGHHPNKPALELVRPAGPAPVETWILPIAPDYISERAGGDDVWERVWRAGGHGYVPEFDRDIIEMYVDKWLRRSELQQMIRDTGELVAGSQGQPVRNPLFSEVRHLEKDLVQLSDKLGRNPEARIRLGLGIKHLRTALDEFLDV